MSEDKTQNGYEGSQELDFQDAKEMTVGEAVRKEAEINAGVTEAGKTDRNPPERASLRVSWWSSKVPVSRRNLLS